MLSLRKLFVVLVLATLLLSGCGGDAVEDDVFRVAVIMPSGINDLAFSQSIYDSVRIIQDEMGGPDFMQFVYSENMFVVDDAAAAIRDYAAEGYDLIIAHGSQYGSSLREIAPDFPTTSFAHGTTADTFVELGINNVFAYEAASDEGGFVNGMIATMMTQSGVVGVVGPIETGDAQLYVDGFVAGVRASDPDVQVNVNYIGSFSDVALAAEAANTHVQAGADVMAGTAQMVVGAIGVARDNDVYWIGTQASQTSLAPDHVLANQIYDWAVVLRDIIAQIEDGVYGGKAYVITLANQGQVMEYNTNVIPPEVLEAARATEQGLIDGTISTGVRQ